MRGPSGPTWRIKSCNRVPVSRPITASESELSSLAQALQNPRVDWQPSYPITTSRLTIRPLTESDIDELVAYRGDADVCRYLPFEPMSRELVATRVAGDLGRVNITAEGQGLTLGVELASNGRLIGDVVLFLRSIDDAGGELGYVFHPDVTGQGYGTEACVAMLDLAFDASNGLGLHRVVARMDARNAASARLAERLGMRREAHYRSREMFKGEWADLVVYAVLDSEWRDRITRDAERDPSAHRQSP